MNFQLSNLQDLEQLVTTLFANNKCACHIINPHKTRILLWKEVKADQITYYLRIGIQKFISQEQIDRNGEIYWRFGSYDYSEVKTEATKVTESEMKQELDPITKFQQRQAQAQNGKATNAEQSVNNSQSS